MYYRSNYFQISWKTTFFGLWNITYTQFITNNNPQLKEVDLWIAILQKQLQKAPKEEWLDLDSVIFKTAERKKDRMLYRYDLIILLFTLSCKHAYLPPSVVPTVSVKGFTFPWNIQLSAAQPLENYLHILYLLLYHFKLGKYALHFFFLQSAKAFASCGCWKEIECLSLLSFRWKKWYRCSYQK